MQRRISRWLAVLAILSVAGAEKAYAQSGGADHAMQFRFGRFFPEGGGEFWDESQDVFTLKISDFDEFMWGSSYVRSLSNHFEVGLNIDVYQETVGSSYKDFVDSNLRPILHDSELEMIPLTVDVRFLPAGRYRMRGSGKRVLKPAFYIGAGIGVNFWDYEERGDFLDFTFDPPEIFFDVFRDDGEAFQAHALIGLDLPVSPRFNWQFQGRYTWADDDLGGAFSGLGKIELGGAAAFVGGSVRF